MRFLISNFGFRRLTLGLFTASALLADMTTLRAQGCAMCYNTAAAAKATAIQALRSGILILLVPVALLFIGIFVLVFRSRERFDEPSSEQSEYDQEPGIAFPDCGDIIELELCGPPHPWALSPKGARGK